MISYQNLEGWKKAMQIVKEVYVLCKAYPKEENYALTSQTKRAVVSIAANIAEGFGRNYKKETIHFLHISRGSIYEVETLLKVAVMVEYVNDGALTSLKMLIDEEKKILNGLIRSLEERTDLK